MDRAEATRPTPYQTLEQYSLDLFGKIDLSFKLIEVLGQIANNYYGSLDGEKKADILEEIYSLGFRGLRALFEDIEEYLEAIQKEIDNLIEKMELLQR